MTREWCWWLLVSAVVCCSQVTASGATPGGASAAQVIQLPGAPAFDGALQTRLRQACAAEGATSTPHAAHLNTDNSPKYVNRLVFETSPYLQQHAFNPVNWYPWGDEAFATARREDKPIFLSIGYSTCHWCHVMERECFENEAIAQLLNEHFVAVKVDREERPDLDNVYVAAVQRMTGSAGWPLTVFLTPERMPFYGGTYFPPEDRYGKPGLPKLLTTVADLWKTKRQDVAQASTALTASLEPSAGSATTVDLTAGTLGTAYQQLSRSFDATDGGFGGAPKFPQAHMLQFLLRYWQRTGEAPARRAAEVTLDHMARGGIHDQLGGGFHRYSTDAKWVVPHFEKMLYDQANNARAYLEAFQAGGEQAYAQVARDVFTYVLRDLTAPGGAFYAAEDADSDGEEGRFYLWSRPEIIAVLGAQNGALIADFYGVTDSGGSANSSPLHIVTPAETFIKPRGLDAPAFTRTVNEAGQLLLAARNRRPRPSRDEKVITAWNGLMISSLAYGSTVLGDPQYAVAAVRAADFILKNLQRDGRLVRTFRGVASATPGYLDDYAFLILGLTDLYAATFEVRWLREADRLSRAMLVRFADPSGGGLRYRASDAEPLIAAGSDAEDAALPAAQSVAALVLLRVGRLTMNQAFETQGRALLAAYSQDLAREPTAHTQMLTALDFALGPTKEIVVAGAPDAEETKPLLAVVRRHYLPRSVVALHPPNDDAIETLVPFLKEQKMINDKPTVYVCENYVCKLPTNDPARLETLLVGESHNLAQGK